MDLASVVAALASVGVRVSGSTPNNNVQGDSSRACPTGLAGPEPSGTLNDPGQHFQAGTRRAQHRTETPERGAPEDQGKSSTTHHDTHGTDTTHTAHTQRFPATHPAAGGQTGEGQRLTPSAPHHGGRHPPRGRPSAIPTASNAGPQGRTLWGGAGPPRPHRPRPGHAGRGTLAARSGGRAAGGGTAPGTKRPSQRWKAAPPGDALPPPPQRATPARKGARCGAGAGSTRPHRPHPGHTGRGTLAARSGGRAAGGGTAPDTRRPSQRWKAPPPGTPFRHPHSEQRRPARAHAVGPVLGPHARIDRTRDTRVAEPWLHAPEDERPREGQRLTPGAPHNGGRHPPRGRPSATPTASNAGSQGRTLWVRCWVHTPASTAPGTHGPRNPGCTLRRTSGRGRDSA